MEAADTVPDTGTELKENRAMYKVVVELPAEIKGTPP